MLSLNVLALVHCIFLPAMAATAAEAMMPIAARLGVSQKTLGDDGGACSNKPYSAGCLCWPFSKDSGCAKDFPCAGNRTEYDQGTCGGDVDTITCPRDNATEFVDFWIQNTTSKYCANTQIRVCDNENGCMGMKYRNDTTAYKRCPLEYGNPATGHYAVGDLSLPAKVRIGKEAKYITFVCDPDPGVKVPIVSEYWPSGDNQGWPKSLPPMGKSNCSECTGNDYCPWKTHGIGSDCECCARCTPDHGSYPPQYNISIDNPTQHPWKVQLWLQASHGSYEAKPSTCVLRNPFYGPQNLYPSDTSMVEEWRGKVDAAELTQVPPGAKNFIIGIPDNVLSIKMVPMYTSTLSTCVVESLHNYGAPKRIVLTDHLPSWCKDRPGDCGMDCITYGSWPMKK